jgi:hypothetical protein
MIPLNPPPGREIDRIFLLLDGIARPIGSTPAPIAPLTGLIEKTIAFPTDLINPIAHSIVPLTDLIPAPIAPLNGLIEKTIVLTDLINPIAHSIAPLTDLIPVPIAPLNGLIEKTIVSRKDSTKDPIDLTPDPIGLNTSAIDLYPRTPIPKTRKNKARI